MRLKSKRFVLDEPLSFKGQIRLRQVEGKLLYIAIHVPTWIVVDSVESRVMEDLIAGRTLRETISKSAEINGISLEVSADKVKALVQKLHFRDFFNDSYPLSDEYVQNTRHFQFHLTNRCNLRCVHCYMNSGEQEFEDLPLNKWMSIIDEVSSRYSKWFLSLTGGEPTIYNGFLDILSYAKQQGATTGMISNGLTMTPQMVRRLEPFLDHIQISLDGATAAVNDSIRGKGVHARVMRAFDALRGSDIRVGMNVTIMKTNVEDIRDNLHELIHDRLRDMDIDLDISGFVPEGRGANLAEGLSSKEFTSALHYTADHFVSDDKWMPTPSYPRRNCGYGNTVAIYSNGDVSPCLSPRFIRGNILKDDMVSLFNAIDLERSNSFVDQLHECKTCDLRYVCGGRCHLGTLTKNLGISQVDCSDEYKNRMLRNLVREFELSN